MTIRVLTTESDVIVYGGGSVPSPVAELPKASAHVKPSTPIAPVVEEPVVEEPVVAVDADPASDVEVASPKSAPEVASVLSDEATLVEQLKQDHTIQELRTIAKDAHLDTSGSKNDLAVTIAKSIVKNR